MIVTEEEAKTKWCQEARKMMQLQIKVTGNPVSIASANRNSDDLPLTSCIGSACMAWRWRGGMGDQEKGTGILLGYCGKAGKP